MATAATVWDYELYGAPAISGFTVSFESSQIRQEPLSGAGRFHRRQETILLAISMNVPQTAAQHAAFQTLWRDTLRRGKLAVQIELYVGTVLEPVVGHIVEGYTYQIIGRHDVHAMVQLRFEGYRAEVTDVSNVGPAYIVAGHPPNPSPDDELIEAGTPLNPSSAGLVIYGGEYIGFSPAS